jgi:hypothetical protein
MPLAHHGAQIENRLPCQTFVSGSDMTEVRSQRSENQRKLISLTHWERVGVRA